MPNTLLYGPSHRCEFCGTKQRRPHTRGLCKLCYIRKRDYGDPSRHINSIISCKTCGVPCTRTRRTQRYCSYHCYKNREISNECETCGGYFFSKSKKRKFCSIECCYGCMTIVSMECKICKNTFLTRRRDAKYCSRKCARVGSRKATERECKKCKRVFLVRPSTPAGKGKYCSIKCRDAIKTEKAGLYKKCMACSSRFWSRTKANRKFCSVKCSVCFRTKRSAKCPTKT